MKRQRRHFSPKDKVAVLRRHLLEKTLVSDLCEELSIQPTTFYQWQRQFFENGEAAFASKPGKRMTDPNETKIAKLTEKVDQKNEVIAELLQEHVQLKKELGEATEHDCHTAVTRRAVAKRF